MSAFVEQVVPGFAHAYEGNPLVSERSEFQRIDIYETDSFGRLLMLDGLVQTTERDEFVYHEMLVHVPLLSHALPRTVLIIGGGDGGTLRRVLEHPSVERAVMVEIDQRVTDVCRELMPSIAADAFESPRADVRFADGIAFVNETDETYDAILIDNSDPVGPGEALFTPEFYKAASARLRPGGVLAAQSGSPYFQQTELNRTYASVTSVFPSARPYLAFVPTYPGCLWSFMFTGRRIDVREARARAQARRIRARYWTPEIHTGAFALPQIVLDVIAPGGPPLTWGLSPAGNEIRA